MASGFIPSHKKGVVILLIILPYFAYLFPKTSIKKVTKAKERPVIPDVKNTKLIDHNLLLRGIKKVSG
jgi:hypothetical protein